MSLKMYLYLVVVSTRNKQRLLTMEADSSDGTIMLIVFVQQCAHTIIPELQNNKF